MENCEPKVLNSAMKSKQKRRLRGPSFVMQKMVRILEPTDTNKQEKDSVNLPNFNSSLTHKGVFADNPNDLLKGISDMFVRAELSCNFAKKQSKIGWNTLSSTILNRLHPGNEIFQQQLAKMKQEKENYESETKQRK